MKKISAIVTLFIIAAGIPATALPQVSNSYKDHPAYIDFGNLGIKADAEERVEVLVEEPLLKFVSKASSGADAEFSDFLDKLKLIKADIFSVTEDQEGVIRENIARISGELQAKNWQRMVLIREKDEYFEVYALLNNDVLEGLIVMGLDGGKEAEAIFVNIVGEIDPEQLGKLSSKFNIPGIDSLHLNNR